MKAKAWRLYGAADARLEDIELEGAAEDYLLAHAPKVEIGEPKELVKERIIRLG